MGIVNFGIPEQEMQWLKRRMKLTTAVEGGSYLGGTALNMSKEFVTVFTIEKSDVMFRKAKKKIGDIPNITQLCGDTRDHLPKIVSETDSILFWLDAHWSGGETYGKQDECPLLRELDIIFSSAMRNYVILVDDARLFLAPPPLPHQVKNWPTIKQIVNIIPSNFDMIIHDDVIFIVPVKIGFPKYIQGKTTSNWLKYAELSRPSLKNCFAGLLSSIVMKFKKRQF
jgi:hypothetical protein